MMPDESGEEDQCATWFPRLQASHGLTLDSDVVGFPRTARPLLSKTLVFHELLVSFAESVPNPIRQLQEHVCGEQNAHLFI